MFTRGSTHLQGPRYATDMQEWIVIRWLIPDASRRTMDRLGLVASHLLSLAGAMSTQMHPQGSTDLLPSALAGLTTLGRAEVNHLAVVFP